MSSSKPHLICRSRTSDFFALLHFFHNKLRILFRHAFVTLSQPINALAFVFDGLYYGVSDYAYAAYSMVIVGFVSSVFLLIASAIAGLSGVWAGLFLFMFLRAAAGFWRLGSKAGPWKMVLSEEKSKINEATEE